MLEREMKAFTQRFYVCTLALVFSLALASAHAFCPTAFASELEAAELQPQASSGAVLNMKFDDNFKDSSKHATVSQHGNKKFSLGKTGKAAFFDGNGDYVTLGNKFDLNGSFTLNVWLNPSEYIFDKAYTAILAKRKTGEDPTDSFDGSYAFYLSYGMPHFYAAKDGSSSITTGNGTPLDWGRWQMLTYTYDTSRKLLEIYVNGKRVASDNIMGPGQSAATVTVGRQCAASGRSVDGEYRGYLDDLTLYNRKLSAKEITSLYKNAGNRAADFKITIAKKAKYTGKQVKPAPVVRYMGVKLKNGIDYTLSYRNNVKPGTATLVVKGKGNFKGSKKATFKIVREPQTHALLVRSVKYAAAKKGIAQMKEIVKTNKLAPGKKTITKFSYNCDKKLSSKNAKRVASNLKNAIKKAYSKSTASDIAVFYYVGHGCEDGLMTSADYNFSYKQLAKALSAVKCKKMYVFLDACHAGAFYKKGLMKLKKAKRIKIVAFMGSAQEQFSEFIETKDKKMGYSRFTSALFGGLGYNGQYADSNKDGAVTAKELSDYLDIKTRSDLIESDPRWNDQNPVCYCANKKTVVYKRKKQVYDLYGLLGKSVASICNGKPWNYALYEKTRVVNIGNVWLNSSQKKAKKARTFAATKIMQVVIDDHARSVFKSDFSILGIKIGQDTDSAEYSAYTHGFTPSGLTYSPDGRKTSRVCSYKNKRGDILGIHEKGDTVVSVSCTRKGMY